MVSAGGLATLVQFMHPGGEHGPAGAERDWNVGSHRRLFVRAPGTCIDLDGTERAGPMVFWAEWEAEAELLRSYPAAGDRGPRYLFAPFYRPRRSYFGLQNTDPFVFGDQFHYAGCQQYRKG